MSNIYRVRPDNISTDIVLCLSQLHAQALRGTLTGIAYVAYIEDHSYIANAAGSAIDDPTHTRGMLSVLDDKLARHVGESGDL